MNDDQHLNPDAIYVAMAWLREYAESPEGQEEYRRLEERRKAVIHEHELTEGDPRRGRCINPVEIDSIYRWF